MGLTSRKRTIATMLILVILVLIAATAILGQRATRREQAHSSAKRKQGQSAEIAPASFASGSPSKEYIYAGGRLVATEEPTLVNAPSDLRITGITSSSVSLAWTDNSANEDGFQIKRDSPPATFTVGANVTAFTDSGLSGSTTFGYEIRAFKGAVFSDPVGVAAATLADTQAPTITCPANQTAVAAASCTPATGKVVNYPAPAATDNCPGVTASCSPASGSTFPVGTTTVTCTATDASGNTATCSFTVTVFNGCLQDESNAGNVVLLNLSTGEYRFCCNGTVLATGKGTVSSAGCSFTIQHNPSDRRVTIKIDLSTKRGIASLQMPPGSTRCTISDGDISNNSCQCAAKN